VGEWQHGEWHGVGEGNVIIQHHEEHKVAILTPAQVGGHSTSIGKEFLLEQL